MSKVKSIRLKGKLLEWWEDTKDASAICRQVLAGYVFSGNIPAPVKEIKDYSLELKEIDSQNVEEELNEFSF